MTTIRYFIPEDGDSETFPNVFLAPKPRQPGYPPTLGEIKHAFPLPGRYHFRFKSPLVPGSDRDKGALAVWLDCVDDGNSVPTWKSSIVAKVTRIGVEDDDDDEDAEFPPSSAPVSTPVPASAPAPSRPEHHHAQSKGSIASLDIFDGPSPSVQTQHSMSAPPSTGSLLDGHAPVAATVVKDSLLDMSAPVFSSSSSPAHADFFGMTTTATNTTPNLAPLQAQQAPMSGGYHSQHQQQPPVQYGMSSSQPQHQRPPNNNAFNSFGQQNGPFGDLGTPWK